MIFSPLQEEIINHASGALLIQGVPGSGKSSMVAERLKRYLNSRPFSKINILAPSYSSLNKIQILLEKDSTINSELLQEKIKFNTFHSFSLEILRRFGSRVGIRRDIRFIDADSDIKAIMHDVLLHDPIFSTISSSDIQLSDFISKYLELISSHKQHLITPELSLEDDPFPRIYSKYNEALKVRNLLDYNDILFYINRLLAENDTLNHLYTALYSQYYCLDAHRLSESQYQMLHAHINVTKTKVMTIMVGDLNDSASNPPNQYMSQNFVFDFNPKIYNLTKTYRSSNKLVDFTNYLTNQKLNLPCHFEGLLKKNYFISESDEAKFVYQKIADLMQNEQYISNYDEIAIIARNKYSFNHVISELSNHNVPYSFLKSDYNISIETDVFNVLCLAMKMINNPKDIINKKLLCNLIEREKLIIDKNDPNLIAQLLKGTKFDWMISILNKLHDENELDFDDILDSVKLLSPHQSSDYYNYFFENDYREWSAQWARFRKLYPDKKWLIYTFFYALHLSQGLNLNLPSSVKLLTPNMFGNYAFEAVFVIDLAEGTFPDYRAISKGEASIDEERDRLQTAVNNSKRLCYLSCAKSKEMPWGEIKFQEPSRFIANYNATESADVSADNFNKR